MRRRNPERRPAGRRTKGRLEKLGVASFALVLGLIVYATLTPINLRPNSGHLHPERILAFLALGGSLACAFPRQWLATLTVTCVLAIGLEGLQTLIPSRHGRVADAFEKAVGGAAGVLLGMSLTLIVERYPRSRET